MAKKRQNQRTCKKDGFPMVKIRGRWVCAAEYLDACIGGQHIADVIEQDDTIYYVFDNGHKLPLLCFCCGEPLGGGDLEKTRRRMQGRQLVGMQVQPVELESGGEVPFFELEFAGKLLSKPVYSALSPLVAVHLDHPPTCRRG